MKRLSLSFSIIFVLIAGSLHAQQIMIGARAGVNLANRHFDNSNLNTTLFLHLLAGGELDYSFNKMWALSLQLLYDQKGAHADTSFFTTEESPNLIMGTADWTTTYLEIPILAKVTFDDESIRPHIFAGPSIGILLSNTERFQSSGSSSPKTAPSDTTVNITDYTATIDLSIVAGAGISLSLASGPMLFFDAAYAYGLTSITKSTSSYTSNNNIYSRDIRLAAGVLFPIP